MKPFATQRRRAFATVFVIALLALVTTALAGLVLAARVEQMQTMTAMAGARMRQLELAAVIDSTARSSAWGETPMVEPWTFESPDGGTARIDPIAVAKEVIKLRIECTAGSARSVQTSRFIRSGSKWTLAEVSARKPGN